MLTGSIMIVLLVLLFIWLPRNNDMLVYTKLGEYHKPIHTLVVYTDTNKYYLNGKQININSCLDLVEFMQKWENVSYNTNETKSLLSGYLLLNKLGEYAVNQKFEFNKFHLKVLIY